ncbi:ATP-grasp domain-containing protein [Modestobacter roseus]|uniref:ATP-grasp domain-containing protein n=1 Tax=Modestobacter roseus TaxID=1181884 RepID=UPI0034E02FA0
MPAPRRALVLTAGRARGSLAAVRALHQAGWTVGVGTPDGAGMVTTSRACARAHRVARPRGDCRDFLDGIRDAVADGGYDVVFGGGDDWMAALALYRDEVPAVVPHPAADVVDRALDKVGLTERARAVGLAAPRTELATEASVAGWQGPVVVKCRAHWRPQHAHPHRIEARSYPDVRAAGTRIERLREAGLEPVLQQPVEGELTALIGLFVDGELRGRVHQRSPRLWPTPSGVSCRAETLPVDPGLTACATDLLTDLGWSGLVELQFLRDGDGVPHLIDLNGRFFGSMALANAAGANLADAWGRQVLGRPVPPLADARPGVRFLWTAGDLRRAAVERRGGLVADVASTLRWLPGATTSVWRLADPGPTLELVTSRFRRRRRSVAER